jgi:hypothetical protein
MRKTDIWIGVLCCFLLIACDGKKQKSLSVNDDNKSLTFTLPEVPIMLQSPEDRLNFMVQHYWDHFNFKDTAYIHVPDITEQALVLIEPCAIFPVGQLFNPDYAADFAGEKNVWLFCGNFPQILV